MNSVYEHDGRVFVTTEADLDFLPEFYWGSFDTKSEADDEAQKIAADQSLQWHEDGTGNWVRR